MSDVDHLYREGGTQNTHFCPWRKMSLDGHHLLSIPMADRVIHSINQLEQPRLKPH